MALLALLLIAALIYLPGWLLVAAIVADQEAPDWLERIYERTLFGALLNGWLALLLAELGVFSIWLHVLVVGLVCAGGWFFARRRGAKWLRRDTDAIYRVPTWGLIVILLLFTGFVVARPFEVVLGVRDAGVYANTGFAIARTGGIVQHDSIVAEIEADQQGDNQQIRDAAAQAETNFLGVQPRQRTIATRLRQAGFFINEGDMATGRVVPQGFHLFPAWIALLTSLGGMQAGLAATGLLGLLGLWSVAMLGRRLAGPWVGVATAALLATNGVQIWFSRYSTAEAIAQFLTFAGLYAFAAMVGRTALTPPLRSSPLPVGEGLGERERPTIPAHGGRDISRPYIPALLCGLAIGQLALTRIDFALVVAPLLAYVFYTWLRKRWQPMHSWLSIGLFAMLIHAAIHIATIARAYFFDTLYARLQDYAITALITLPFLTPTLRDTFLRRPCSPIAIQPCPPVAGMPETTFTDWNYARIGTEFGLLALVIVLVLAIRYWGQPLLHWFETLFNRLARLLALVSAIAIALLGGYAYLIRPQILTPATLAAIPGCVSSAQLRSPQVACLALQGYIGAPIASPAYANSFMAWATGLSQQIRGRAVPALDECTTFRASMLPESANGYTSVELVRDGVVNKAQIGTDAWTKLQACDRLVLRDLISNAQANMVRVGWYLSPLGMLLAIAGLALWWRRMRANSWLFLVVALIGTFTFIRITYGTSDQQFIYILRRYVPQVYPAMCLGIAYLLVGRRTGCPLGQPQNQEPRTENRRTAEPRTAEPRTAEPRTKEQFSVLSVPSIPSVVEQQQQEPKNQRTSLTPVPSPTGRGVPVGRGEGRKTALRSIVATLLLLALVAFNLATNLKIIGHTEYAGAVQQIAAIAGQFNSRDVILLRGGAPTFAQARDIPDNLATPLTYGFGLNAFTIKSAQPGRYAKQLATYVQRWRAEGREVYLLAGASGAVGLPGLAFEHVTIAQLNFPEFEQPTTQKPTNVQAYVLELQLYRVVPAGNVPNQTTIAPNNYATQVAGFYRTEALGIGGTPSAWTNGDALLRIARPTQPITLTLRLSPGATRPASLGQAQVCLSYRVETSFWVEDPQAPPFSMQECQRLLPDEQSVQLVLDPRHLVAGESLLVRIQSDTWIPARDDPAQRDGRRLGVLFGGAQWR